MFALDVVKEIENCLMKKNGGSKSAKKIVSKSARKTIFLQKKPLIAKSYIISEQIWIRLQIFAANFAVQSIYK